MARVTLVAIFLAIGMICLSTAFSEDVTGPTTAPTTGPAATATAPAQLPAAIEFHRTGGFVGTDDKLTVATDGSYTTAGKLLKDHKGKMDAADLAALAKALADANIKADAQYKADSGIKDGFQYDLKTAGHTVTWEDMAKLPKEFEALAAKINDLILKIQEENQLKAAD